MNFRISSGIIRTLTGFLIVAILVAVGTFVATLPWSLDRQVAVVLATASGLFFITTLWLLRRTPGGSKHTSTTLKDQELFAELYTNSPVPYIRTDNKGNIIDVNVAAVRLFGQTKEELVHTDLFAAFIGDEEVTEHVNRIPELVSAGSFVNDQEVQLKRIDGDVRWVMLSAFPYDGRRESLITLVDITKQKNVENAKSEFVSLASHQLRTPISSIKWNVELLTSPTMGELTTKQRGYVDKVTRSAERMALLIDDFLNASRLEMGTFEPEISSISLQPFINEQLEESEARIQNNKITVERSYEPEDLQLSVDTHLLRMTISNLISNAIKYTPAGGVVSVGYRVKGEQVEIEVRDTGMGIPEVDQSKLFSKFYRASNARKSAIEGTGIGLYIVHQAIKRMDGVLSFGSKEGVGTRFVVTIPLLPA